MASFIILAVSQQTSVNDSKNIVLLCPLRTSLQINFCYLRPKQSQSSPIISEGLPGANQHISLPYRLMDLPLPTPANWQN